LNHRDTEGTEAGIGLRGREFATTQNDASGSAGGDTPDISALTGDIIGAAIEVHKALGPGLLESAYEECLCRELELRGISFKRQQTLPVLYKGLRLDCGYRVDLVVEESVIVELKACDELLAVHQAQLLTYLKLTGLKVGLLINFNVPVLKNGIRRLAM
jgi:GxxExxY protein